MLTGSDVMSRPLWVAMDADERKAHVDSLLRHLERVDELRDQRAKAVKKFAEQIDEELDEVMRLRRVLRDDGRQMTLADATVDDVPAEPSKAEATKALADVAQHAERPAPRFHKRGELCTNGGPCKRRHLSLDQLHEAGLEPQGGVLCPGCEQNTLTAIEAVKGCCESCQLAKPGDALDGTSEAQTVRCEGCKAEVLQSEAVLVDERNGVYACSTCAPKYAGEADQGDEDPRPRCINESCGHAVLDADEVEVGNGICFACEDGVETEAGQQVPS